MKQVILRQGAAAVDEVPAPRVEPGTVLVGVRHSCISIGTEMSGLRSGGMPLWKRALNQPANVQKAVKSAMAIGPARTWSMISGQLAAGNATGYSAAGVVLEVGEDITDLVAGDEVACAGAQAAHHAEVIRVPRNLVVPVPEGLSSESASTVTLGAIAMQGVRRAEPTLGETFVVIGLGILGQITAQLLLANGCRVIGSDLDRRRAEQALGLGMNVALDPDDESAGDQVARLTDGIGADGVIITAATPSNAVVSTAFKMCRKKGRVVLVGDVGLDLNRSDFYQKELDFRISSSYGPGRYDRRYEEEGLDYPVSYVRWTENRNMAEYLRLLAEGRVRVESLVEATYPVSDASEAYARLKDGSTKPLMVLLSYPDPAAAAAAPRRVPNPRASRAASGRVRIALVGAGGFAKGMHLPNIASLDGLFHIQAVVSRTGHNASATATQFNANYATTEYEAVLADPDVDAVLIATRHDLHASMAVQALDAGKHVLVEKPLAINRAELDQVRAWFEVRAGKPTPVLLTGFNRRFSAYGRRLAELTARRTGAMVMNYRMNAGYIPLDHWTHGKEGGGRNIGEACHIYDLFTALTHARTVKVSAAAARPSTNHYSARDNFIATIEFEDGSIASLTYTAMGTSQHPKEQMEVFVDGKVLRLDDYQRLDIKGSRASGVKTTLSEKGQKDEVEAFARAILDGGEWPIPLWEQLQAMDIAFSVEQFLGDTR